MSDSKNRQRVARLRQSRRERGFTETNVWIPTEIRTAIEKAVKAGRFPSRRMAISYALERAFTSPQENA